MKNLFVAIFLCIISATSSSNGNQQNDEENGFRIGDTIPKIHANDVYGKQVSLEKLNGKVVIITIEHFDQEEQPTEEEEKEVGDFYEAHKKQGLEVVRIASKRGVPFFISKSFVENKAKEYLADHNQTWVSIIDWESSLKELFKMTDRPLIFVVDKQGVIRYKKIGVFIVDKELDALIQKLLKE